MSALQDITRKSLEAVISTLDDKYITSGDGDLAGQSEAITDQCLRECCGEAASILSRIACMLELGESIREMGHNSGHLPFRLRRIEKRLRGDFVAATGDMRIDNTVSRIYPIAASIQLPSVMQHIVNETNITVNRKGAVSDVHNSDNMMDSLWTNKPADTPLTIEELRDCQQKARAHCYRYCQSALPLSSPLTDLATSNYIALQQQANQFLAEELSEICATKKLAEDLNQVKACIDSPTPCERRDELHKCVVTSPCCRLFTVLKDTVTLDLRGTVCLFIRYNMYEKKWVLNTTSAPGVLLTVYTHGSTVAAPEASQKEEVMVTRLHSCQQSTIITDVHSELQKGLSEGVHCALKLACAVIFQFIKMKLDVILLLAPYSSRISTPRISINPSRDFICIAFDVSPREHKEELSQQEKLKRVKTVTCKLLFDFIRATIVKVVQSGTGEQLKEDLLVALFKKDIQGIFLDIEDFLKSFI